MADVFTFRVREPRVRGLASVSAVVRVPGQTPLSRADHADKVAGKGKLVSVIRHFTTNHGAF